MTLANTELVYQSDYMNVSPSADGAVFSGIGNRIIMGLVPTLVNGSVQVTAGKALVQGRLFELTATTTYTPTQTGGQYLGLMVDLTQQNQDGDTVQNNQYTVGFFSSPSGDLNKGDTKANISIWWTNTTDYVDFDSSLQYQLFRRWAPNTRYNVGDMVIVKSLNGSHTDNGYLKNAILKANISHTSSTTFPASSAGTWTLINIDAYFRTGGQSFGYGRTLIYQRMGNILRMGYYATAGTTNKVGAGTTNLAEKLPNWANPDVNGTDMAVYINNIDWPGTTVNWTLSIHNNANTSSFSSFGNIDAGVILRGNGTTITNTQPEWLEATPD
ncbi:MAG: hypothetical protein WBP82_00435 [Leuconostoc mesenteroides]